MTARAFVLHWNRPAECARTVELLAGNLAGLRVEVVDNASLPENVAALRAVLPEGVRLHEMPENLGWGGGFNPSLAEWLKRGDEPVCFVAAHDAMPEGGCLPTILTAMEADERLGVCCPQYPDGAVARFQPVRGQWLETGMPGPFGSVEEMDFVHGTLMAFRRVCLEDVGLFDERYFAHGDETEIALRARRREWRVGQVRGAVVVNPHSWTPDEIKGYLSTRGSLLLAQQYGGVGKAIVRVTLVLANTARMVASGRAEGLSSAGARIAAVRDFLRGKYGPPPRGLA